MGVINEWHMSETTLQHVFINFSKRKVTIVDDEGYERDVQWKWDQEGSEGFSETIDQIQQLVDPDLITYCFAVK